MKILSEQLAENLSYYITNPKNRCVAKLGKCFYSGKTANKRTEGCFVGRLLKPADRIKADKYFETSKDSSGVTSLIKLRDTIGIELPNIIIDNPYLMDDFQMLHDNMCFWNESGLTLGGKDYLRNVITKYKLDIKPFEKFL